MKLDLANRLKLPAQTLADLRDKVCAQIGWTSQKSYYNSITEKVEPTAKFAEAFAVAVGVPLAKVMDIRFNFYEVESGVIVALTPYQMKYVAAAAAEDDNTIYTAALQAAKVA